MIGQTISHYTILSKLGEGGMGVVYKAEDLKLKRTVALKFLHPDLTRDDDAKARFIHEAQAAAALNHPHICTIYEIDETPDGQSFIAMEFIEGEGLKNRIQRGPLLIDDALPLSIQMGEGLHEAHEKGIVHRDIKPGNIMVTSRGQAKILDFGLARLGTHTKITKTDTTLGTAAYMSPEQATGKEVDRRTDIWSLGVVLYEMMTGARPFTGEYEPAVVYSILHDQPEPLTSRRSRVPMELERMVNKCLEKKRDERYQTAADLIADLRHLQRTLASATRQSMTTVTGARAARRARRWSWAVPVVVVAVIVAVAIYLGKTYLSEPSGKPITSIAVLPFQNLSADPEQEYFSDGTTEALITELSKIKALRVISRTSVMRFKKSDQSLPEIARQLNVDAVVEGSVQRVQSEVRVTAQLVRAAPEKHLWANTYTESYRNILALESEIAQTIAREIRVTMTPDEKERVAASRPVNPEAHEAYLKGKYFVARVSQRDWFRSIEYFQQAIDEDSTYALAYAGMAEAYDVLGSMGILPPREVWPKVKAYAEKALALDPTLAVGILLIAEVRLCYEWDLKGAEEYYTRVIELDPNLALAHHWYGFYLTSQGRFDEGIAEMKRGLRFDPLSPAIIGCVAFGYELAGEYDSAFVYLDRLAEIDSSNSAPVIHLRKSFIHVRQGKYPEAIEEAKKAVSGKAFLSFEILAVAYALCGRTDEARQTLAELIESIGNGYYSPAGIASIYCALGDREKVLAYFDKAVEEREYLLVAPALVPPWCDFIKSDPRYHEIIKNVGIEH
jgi:serine/threonine protein kinase